jgi:hypothetical protein
MAPPAGRAHVDVPEQAKLVVAVSLPKIRQLVVRMAEEDSTWGFTRIQGALKNLGHQVGRSTIARILKADGLSPAPTRPTSWQTFLWHSGAIAAADVFTTEVWSLRGLVTFYAVFVIDRTTRRVRVRGMPPHPISSGLLHPSARNG